MPKSQLTLPQVDMGLAKYHSQEASAAEDASPPQPVLHGGSPDQQVSPMEQDTPAVVERTRVRSMAS